MDRLKRYQEKKALAEANYRSRLNEAQRQMEEANTEYERELADALAEYQKESEPTK